MTTETTITRKASAFPLQTIVEVQDCGRKLANYYLERGYVLLAVTQLAHLIEKSPEFSFVYKDAQYVLGRTADIEHAPFPGKFP